MSLSKELFKLEQLRESGALKPEEYQAVRERLLEYSQASDGDIDSRLLQLELDWQRERTRYLLPGNFGKRVEPDKMAGVRTARNYVITGLIWCALAIAGHAPLFIILAGFLVCIPGMLGGIHNLRRARDFQVRLEKYKAEKSRILSEGPSVPLATE